MYCSMGYVNTVPRRHIVVKGKQNVGEPNFVRQVIACTMHISILKVRIVAYFRRERRTECASMRVVLSYIISSF